MSTSLHVLARAVLDRSAAVARCRAEGGNAEIQIQFLAGAGAGGENGFWAEAPAADAAQLDRLIAAQSPLHVSFSRAHHRFHFDTTLLQRRRSFGRGERLLLAWPAMVRVAERRRAGREPVGEQVAIVVRLRVGQDTPEVPVQLGDLDWRGASLVLNPSHIPPAAGSDRLHLCMNFAGVDHWMVASERHRQILPDGRVRIGVEFDSSQAATLRNGEWFARAMEDIRACASTPLPETAA